jgi:hypothetical protein
MFMLPDGERWWYGKWQMLGTNAAAFLRTKKSPAKMTKNDFFPVPSHSSDDDSNKENVDNETETVCKDTQSVCDQKDIDLLKNNREEEDEMMVSWYCTFYEDNHCMWLEEKEDMMAYDDETSMIICRWKTC